MNQTLSTEQRQILESPAPIKLIIANAGTGKTTTLALLYTHLFLQEEQAILQKEPKLNHEGHIHNPRTLQLLTNRFDAITFTRKAAAELDARIRAMLYKEGVALPKTIPGTRQPIHLARTIDSKIQNAFRNDTFFQILAEQGHPGYERLARIHARLKTNPEFQDLAAKEAADLWDPKLLGTELEELGHLVVLQHLNGKHTLAAELEQAVADTIRKAAKSDREKGHLSRHAIARIGELAAKHRENYASLLNLYHNDFARLPPAMRAKVLTGLKPYFDAEQLAENFLTAYSAIRSHGYHPRRHPTMLQNPVLANFVARMDRNNGEAITIDTFQALALQLEDAKETLGVFDFPDFMAMTCQVIQDNQTLSEPRETNPQLGFRRKHTLLDESQDNDTAQWALTQLIAANLGPQNTLTLCLDPAQSIYQFRGSQPQRMHELARQYPAISRTHHLSTTYRNAPQITALGNEIIRTLSRHRDTKPDSTSNVTSHRGSIFVVAPQNPLDEAEMVLAEIQDTLQKHETILVLYRAHGEHRPLYRLLAKEGYHKQPGVQYLSVHQAKGLEADRVVLVQFSASKWPDVRNDPDEEVNIFYVAVTRARRRLSILCTINENTLSNECEYRPTLLGPSPYIMWIPSLRASWRESGKPEKLLEQGILTHTVHRQQHEDIQRANLQQLGLINP